MKTTLTEYNASSEFEKIAYGLKEKIVKSSEKVMELEKEYGKVTDLYDVVRGHNGLNYHLNGIFKSNIWSELFNRRMND